MAIFGFASVKDLDCFDMKNVDAKSHVRGESIYLDDIALLEGTLYACVYDSSVAHGKLINLDTSEAEKSAGVVKVIRA